MCIAQYNNDEAPVLLEELSEMVLGPVKSLPRISSDCH